MQVIKVDLQTAVSLGSSVVLCELLTRGGPPVLGSLFSGTAILNLKYRYKGLGLSFFTEHVR